MDNPPTIETRVYAGPSLLSEHPVVSLTIPTPLDTNIRSSVIETLLGPTPIGEFTRSVSVQNGSLACSELITVLTQAFLAAAGTPELRVNTVKDNKHQSVILARYHDPFVSSSALLLSFNIARELLTSGENAIKSGRTITSYVKQKIDEFSTYAPDRFAHSLIRVAETKNIPYRIFASASKVWLFGHGAESVQFLEAVTQENGMPGAYLARNKAHTNKFIKSLGFPTTRCAVSKDLASGKSIAKTIGFPVVVKPLDAGKAQGVTANITGDAEFEMAFNKAAKTSTRAVLIENHIAGDDFRIFVVGGRFAWAIKRIPAKVTGNGTQSVRELISQENVRREPLREAWFNLKPITVDHELIRVLKKQGFSLDDRPPEGKSIQLSSVTNISAGGTHEDSTSIIHPDNVEMVECVARCFRLDTVGIDFITPDLGVSWRECECAIIEINAAAGFSTDEHARLVLESKFAHGSDGRIPIILTLNCAAPVHDLLVSELGAKREGVGYISADTCKLDDHTRGDSLVGTSDKVNALLSDPACSSLVIGLTANDIEADGLPVDRCAVSLLSKSSDVPEQIRDIIEGASGTVIEISDINHFKQEQLKDILSRLNQTQVSEHQVGGHKGGTII